MKLSPLLLPSFKLIFIFRLLTQHEIGFFLGLDRLCSYIFVFIVCRLNFFLLHFVVGGGCFKALDKYSCVKLC